MKPISACIISIALVGVPWLCESASAASAEEIRPADPKQTSTAYGYPAMVLQSMLQQMGLELPPESRGGGAPEPEPTTPDDDDFFSDDDFFDEDIDFDDMVDRMDEEFEETVKDWDEEYEKQVAKWEQARAVYLEHESLYRAATIPIESPSDSPDTSQRYDDLPSNIEAMQPGRFHLIPNSMSLPVKDQKGRGTCTAFSGVRALETLLIQHGVATDLSEQQFYFLSKPDCSSKPCDIRREGSTVDAGLTATRESPIALVPEPDCPYIPSRDKHNITFTPLSGCSTNGVVRAGELRWLHSLDQVLVELRNNRPIVVGFSLTSTSSYWQNRGLVRYYDSHAASHEDEGGHANLLIGYIKLPSSLSREGDYCFITVNSWNPGWGRGGYACLTETWLRKYFLSAIAVRSAIMTEAGMEYYGIK